MGGKSLIALNKKTFEKIQEEIKEINKRFSNIEELILIESSNTVGSARIIIKIRKAREAVGAIRRESIEQKEE